MSFTDVLKNWPLSRVPRFMVEWSAHPQPETGEVVLMKRLTEPGYDNDRKAFDTISEELAIAMMGRPEDYPFGIFSHLEAACEQTTSPIDSREELEAMIQEGRWD